MRANISNKELGAKIGLDHTSVSRLRGGDRNPSMHTMARIAVEYNWDMLEQYNAIDAKTYASQFEDQLIRVHGEEVTDGEPTPEATPS